MFVSRCAMVLRPVPRQLVPTSKKPADVRRGEVFANIQGPFLAALVRHGAVYARNKFGAEVLLEAAMRYPSSELFNAIADAAVADPDEVLADDDDHPAPAVAADAAESSDEDSGGSGSDSDGDDSDGEEEEKGDDDEEEEEEDEEEEEEEDDSDVEDAGEGELDSGGCWWL